MTDTAWLSNPGSLATPPPHRHGGHTHRQIVRAWIAAALFVAAGGSVIFGIAAVIVIVVATLSAIFIDAVLAILARDRLKDRWERAALTGLLLSLTLPPTTPWPVAMFGAVIAILIGHTVFHGRLQPALIGRIVVQFVFSGFLSTGGPMALSPILTPGHLLVGDVFDADHVTDYHGWFDSNEDTTHDAYLIPRPVQVLRQFAQQRVARDGDLIYTPLLRDQLPPWSDTLFGVVPGGIGETSAILLLVAGLYLIHRGFLRWQLPVAMLATVFVAVSILPIESNDAFRWFPIVEAEQHQAVGLAYVLFHLTAGQLLLTAFLLAGDFTASPLRVHGQVIYAAGVGAVAVFMRLYGLLDGECYWAVIIMNVFVGMIDRNIRRPVLGLEG